MKLWPPFLRNLKMALILNCDKCEKRMSALEQHIIVNDKYLCINCGEVESRKKKEEDAIKKVYDSISDDIGIGWII